MTVYSVRIEHGGKDNLSYQLEYVEGMTEVIQLFMQFSEQPQPYRFTVTRMDNIDMVLTK